MINRIRDIRIQKGLTLADVAVACRPPTTAQTIGRLETGTRNLSLSWMNRIAAALEVEPELLLRSDTTEPARIVANLLAGTPEPSRSEIDAVAPTDMASGLPYVVMTIADSCGEYRAGDQLWLRRHDPGDAPGLVNRDVLVPRPGGRFAFGRLFNCEGTRIGLLPPAVGQRQVVVDGPAWIGAADMLIRKL